MDFRLRTPDLGPPSLSSFPSFPFVELARPHPRAPRSQKCETSGIKANQRYSKQKNGWCPLLSNPVQPKNVPLPFTVPDRPGLSRNVPLYFERPHESRHPNHPSHSREPCTPPLLRLLNH